MLKISVLSEFNPSLSLLRKSSSIPDWLAKWTTFLTRISVKIAAMLHYAGPTLIDCVPLRAHRYACESFKKIRDIGLIWRYFKFWDRAVTHTNSIQYYGSFYTNTSWIDKDFSKKGKRKRKRDETGLIHPIHWFPASYGEWHIPYLKL